MTTRPLLLSLVSLGALAVVQAGFLRNGTSTSSAAGRDLQENTNSSSRIVGGVSVQEGDTFPFMADWHKGCGGSLIAPDIVLTAGHCEQNPIVRSGNQSIASDLLTSPNPNPILIPHHSPFSFGSVIPDDNQAPYVVAPLSYAVHPSYTKAVGNIYDIMLGKLYQSS